MTLETTGELLIFSLPIISVGVTLALTAGGIYLSSRYRHNKLVQALLVLDNVVIDVVTELNKTVVGDLKRANADGKLTKDEAEQIKSKAIDLVLTRLGANIIKIMQKQMGPIVVLIAAKIEAAVFDNKKRDNLSKDKKANTIFRGKIAV